MSDFINDLLRQLGWGKEVDKHETSKTKETTKQEKTGQTGHRTGKYGAVSIAEAFKGADFPMSKKDIIDCFGNKEVEYHKDHKEKISDLLGDIPDRTYDSPIEIEKAFHSAEQHAGTATTGVYGAVAITQALKGADFPMSKKDILSKYGNKEIEYHKGRREKLSDILSNIPDETYNTTVDLEQAFHESEEGNK